MLGFSPAAQADFRLSGIQPASQKKDYHDQSIHEDVKLFENADGQEDTPRADDSQIMEMKGQDQEVAKSREEILSFLLQEENLLHKFATE